MANSDINNQGLLHRLLQEHVKESIRQELQKVAQSIIDAAVDKACADFEVHLQQHLSVESHNMVTDYIVRRRP